MNKTLWAPWRIDYILAEKDKSCIFCEKPNENNDEANLILHRKQFSFVIMNKYPYNSGHLMVVPYRHLHNLEDLSDNEILDINNQIKLCVKIIKKNLNPDGFNIGINIGKVAGAGIEEHLHYHIVPRWNGDTNFMPVLSNTRIVPQSLNDTYKILKKDFERG